MFFRLNTYLSCYTESGLYPQYLLARLFVNDEHVVISSSAFLPMNLPVTGRRPPSVWEAMSALSPASVRDVAFIVSLIDDAIQSALPGVTYVGYLCASIGLFFVSFLELAEVRFYDKEVHIRIRKQKQNSYSVS